MSQRPPSLAEGPVGPHLVRLTVPMFLGISSMIVASMIDTIYVGRIGTLELAAVSFSFPIIMGLTTVSMGVGAGAASIIARVIGSGDFDRVRRLSTDSLLLVVLLVIVLTAAGAVWLDDLFTLLGADDAIRPLATTYMTIWLLGLPLFSLPMVGTTIMRAAGNARVPGILMVASSVLQVMMAPVLIFGVPGFWDGLGFAGAAWAFVLSRLVTFVFAIRELRRMDLLELRAVPFAEVLQTWREVMRIGLPSTFAGLIGPVGMAVIVALLADYGYAIVAGFGVASRIESLATMVLMALSASTGPFVGQNWGAGRTDRIHEAQSLGYRFSYLWGLGMLVVLGLLGRPIVGFINGDPAVIDATYAFLVMLAPSYGFLGVGMIAGSTFTALGKPMPPLVLSIARMVVIYVPLALLLEIWFGHLGIFGAAAIANVIMGVWSFLWVRRMLRGAIAGRTPAAAEPAAAD